LFYSEKLPGSSKDSPFRVVTSLVYEYFTGKAEQDLERFCETALRTIRDHPVYVRKKRGLHPFDRKNGKDRCGVD
jgi:hypothetical protein